MSIRLAHAKLNLYLRVVRRREDGYHEIETLFQRIGLADKIEIEPRELAALDLECKGLPIDCGAGEENLVARAYRLLSQLPNRNCPGFRITVDKHIPPGAGLGGGSSDAAAALEAMNEHVTPPLERAELATLSLQLGADVPSFFSSSAAIGRGLGELLTPIPHSLPFWAIVALPDYGISTRDVYARYDPGRPAQAPPIDPLLHAIEKADVNTMLDHVYNELEPLAFEIEPRLAELHGRLRKLAGRPVRMTGSGSALYTLVPARVDAISISKRWEEEADVRTRSASLAWSMPPR